MDGSTLLQLQDEATRRTQMEWMNGFGGQSYINEREIDATMRHDLGQGFRHSSPGLCMVDEVQRKVGVLQLHHHHVFSRGASSADCFSALRALMHSLPPPN